MTNITNAELTQMKERAEKATSGDWDYDLEDKEISNGNFMVLRADIAPGGYLVVRARDEDLDFITQAREDVPRLVAEVERLRKEIEQIHSDLNSYTDDYYRQHVQMACTWILEDSQKRLGEEEFE